jgi:hypothetical protein
MLPAASLGFLVPNHLRACSVAQPGGLQVGFSGARFNLKLKMEAVWFLAYQKAHLEVSVTLVI